MKKFIVEISRDRTACTEVVVEAEDEDDAVEKAWTAVDSKDYPDWEYKNTEVSVDVEGIEEEPVS